VRNCTVSEKWRGKIVDAEVDKLLGKSIRSIIAAGSKQEKDDNEERRARIQKIGT
jgi:hypothetical protein